MSRTGADFRGLVPLVLMSALKQAGTVVREPYHRFSLEVPAELLGSIMPVLAELHATPQETSTLGTSCIIHGILPAAQVHILQQKLPGITRGVGSRLLCRPNRLPLKFEPIIILGAPRRREIKALLLSAVARAYNARLSSSRSAGRLGYCATSSATSCLARSWDPSLAIRRIPAQACWY